MPPNHETIPYEISSPGQDFSLLLFMPSPIDYESISLTLSDQSIETTVSLAFYEALEIPQEPTLKDLVQAATGFENTEDATTVKLQVIARDVSLQHLSFYTPLLRELILDGSVVSSLRDLGCGLKALKVLSVNRCGLTSLDGTFGLQTLEELYAARNTIKDISPCSHLPNIRVIDVKSNFIQDIAPITFLTMCPNLEHIILENNEGVTQFPQYRSTVKSLLPNLRKLDGLTFTEAECLTAIKEHNDYEDDGYVELVAKYDSDSPKHSSKKEGFLPPIANLEKLSSVASYTVTFSPKILSPLPSTSSQESPRGSTTQVAPVNKSVFPAISRPSSSSRFSSASSCSSSSDKGRSKKH